MSRSSHDDSSPTPDQEYSTGADHEKMINLLQTPWDAVYQYSADGSTYIKPSFLRGVPVQKINESSPYWDSNWSSLDGYIAQEQEEERAKADYKARKEINPSKANTDQHKLHQDNVSKQRKIREMFGGNTLPHPNQLISKHHMPLSGICEQELMYKIGCKLSDLEFLRSRQILAMEPWDFFRWRVGVTLEKKMMIPGRSGRDQIRSVVHNISSENSSDPLFRNAVLYSASLQNHKARYGSKKKPAGEYKITGKVQKGSTSKVNGKRSAQSASRIQAMGNRRSAEEIERERRERRARRREEYERNRVFRGVIEHRKQKGLE